MIVVLYNVNAGLKYPIENVRDSTSVPFCIFVFKIMLTVSIEIYHTPKCRDNEVIYEQGLGLSVRRLTVI